MRRGMRKGNHFCMKTRLGVRGAEGGDEGGAETFNDNFNKNFLNALVYVPIPKLQHKCFRNLCGRRSIARQYNAHVASVGMFFGSAHRIHNESGVNLCFHLFSAMIPCALFDLI